MPVGTGHVDIDGLISRMSLKQKVAQCFTLGWSGGVITPLVLKMISELECGGLRLAPNYVSSYRRDTGVGAEPSSKKEGRKQDRLPAPAVNLSPRAHVEVLNEVQALAMSREPGIPLHISIDWESGVSTDIMRGGYPLFPSAMGFACAESEELVYETSRAIAGLLKAAGITNVHSTVADINVNPLNPEIQTRSYGDGPQQVAKYCVASVRGWMDGGIAATAKHFLRQGDSSTDAHYEAQVTERSREHLMNNEIYPYMKMIAVGLPSIMLAHQIAPALDEARHPATTSRAVIQGLLRDELGFEGVITTDSMTMGGMLSLYSEEDACAHALAAGNDLILYKAESFESIRKVLDRCLSFCADGRISEVQLDESVRRILLMKKNLGLLETGGWCDPGKLERMLASPKYKRLERTACEKAHLLIRDRKNALPIQPGKKVLVVEQALFMSRYCNDEHFHPYMLWEKVRKFAPGADLYRLDFQCADGDLDRILSLASGCDAVIATSLYNRGAAPDTDRLRNLAREIGEKLIVVTVTPSPLTVVDEMDCVVCCFSEYAPSLEVAAEVIFGKREAGTNWPVAFRL